MALIGAIDRQMGGAWTQGWAQCALGLALSCHSQALYSVRSALGGQEEVGN